MPTKPLKVGITGGIGTGKTMVCQIFSMLNVPVYDADSRAKFLMTSDANVVKQISNNFGSKAYFSNGSLDRAYLAENVFSDEKKLSIINSIVHPAVAQDFEDWVVGNNDHPYVIKEAALLIESGSYKSLDYLIAVLSPLELRKKRILERDPHRNSEQVREIMDKQISEEQLLSYCDFIIHNNEKQLIITQVLKLHAKLISLAQAG